MSLHRVTLFVIAALFTAGISSAASACCGGWGVQAPVAYSSFGYGGYSGFGGYAGCGGCSTPTAGAVFAAPVAPPPPPVAWGGWGGGCGCACGCRGFLLSYATPAVEPMPVAPAPIYVVNQGPDYTGPGIMVPYHTWTPAQSYVTPGAYPYLRGWGAGYGYGYGGYGYRGYGYRGYGYRGYGFRGYGFRGYGYGVHRVAFHAGFYGHGFYHRPLPVWRAGMHRYYR